MNKIKAGIVGGAGYTGGELIRLLLLHPHVEIAFVQSYSQAEKKVYETHTDKDYVDMLATSGDLETAKANLKEYWELMHEREQEIQSLAF